MSGMRARPDGRTVEWHAADGKTEAMESGQADNAESTGDADESSVANGFGGGPAGAGSATSVRGARRDLDAVEQLAWFAGSWRFERELTEGPVVHHVSGTAKFTQAASKIDESLYSLKFLESGELLISGVTEAIPVERRLTHHATPDGIDVRFTHGGHYLTLDLSGGECVATHPCAADTYLITVTIDDPDAWTERWRVTGPTKNYSAVTLYRRS